jgi:hypothetical protein
MLQFAQQLLGRSLNLLDIPPLLGEAVLPAGGISPNCS